MAQLDSPSSLVTLASPPQLPVTGLLLKIAPMAIAKIINPNMHSEAMNTGQMEDFSFGFSGE